MPFIDALGYAILAVATIAGGACYVAGVVYCLDASSYQPYYRLKQVVGWLAIIVAILFLFTMMFMSIGG
jgi:hypothetical protein